MGAGMAARQLLGSLRAKREMEIIGFVDDDLSLLNSTVDGVPVMGPIANLSSLISIHHIDLLIVAVASADSLFLARLIEQTNGHRASLIILPTPDQLAIPGLASLVDLRELSADDLINRRTQTLDTDLISPTFENKKILITGAGGSIGREICRQLRNISGVNLYLLDRDETLLVETQNLLSDVLNISLDNLLLCDIQDHLEIRDTMRKVSPDIVIHAAALKHVTFLERYPVHAMRVNVRGTHNVVESARKCGAHLFINISTDKAAAASNVLGASKKVAERLVANHNSETFKCVSVRFGNVLGSRGSLLPLVEYRLRHQLPVFITSRTATRYFMSIQEAVYLVLRGAVAAPGGKVLILEMGKALNIYDLVTKLAQILDSSSPIVVTELGPGENNSELLFSQSEHVEPTEVPGIMQLQSPTLSLIPEELFDSKTFSVDLLRQLINT